MAWHCQVPRPNTEAGDYEVGEPDSVPIAKVLGISSFTLILFPFQDKQVKCTIKNTNAVIDKSEADQNCIKLELT